MKRNYNQLLNDYTRIIDKYGEPEDMTGGFVDQEKFWELLKCPTKQKAADIIKQILDYGFQFDGYYNSETDGRIDIEGCELLTEIYNRYYVEYDY